MKTLMIILSLLSITNFLDAQAITGKISDTDNEAIFFATAALYALPDSSFVAAESTEIDGLFSLDNVKDGSYYIDVSMLGYTDYRIENIVLPSSNSTNYNVRLESDANLLTAVQIKDKLPLMEQKADKLIVNVADNITNTGGSLLDVMKKVPGVLVVNDKLSLAGSGTPTILLNGKTTQYVDVQSLIRDMPGDNIKKVEIIHQPGAEYEAAGSGPIINIILKKNSLFGTNGSVSVGASKGELWDYTTGLNLSHYQGSVNIIGGIGYSRNAYVDELFLERTLTSFSDGINGIYTQNNRDASTPVTYRGNIRVDWDVTEKHRIGVESKYFNNTNNRVTTNVTDINLLSANANDYSLDTDNDISRSWNYSSINPYYIFEIDTAGQKLEFDVNIARYNVAGENTLTTTTTLNSLSDIQKYTQPGDNDIFASSLDYTIPLNDIFELKTGVKYSQADLDNNLISEFFKDNAWVNNVNQSNHYLFNEKVYATFGKLSWKSGDWSGTAGLRYERSESVGTSLTLDTTLTRNISKLFPSFSLSKKLASGLASTVSYSYRINRPRYSSLNPFVYYFDPFTSERGNPNIRPELTHSAKFTLTYEGQPFFNVEYKKSNDAIVEITEQVPNSEEAFKTDVNFDNRTVLSGSLFFPLDFIPGITGGYGGVVVSNTSFSSLLSDDNFDRTKFNTTAFIQAEFNLPGDINAEIGGWFTTGQQEGIFRSEYLYGSSAGVSKKFLDNKAKVSIGIEDFVNRFWNASVDYQQDLRLTSRWQAPVVNARFSYKFGNQHLKSKSKKSGSAAEEINRASIGN